MMFPTSSLAYEQGIERRRQYGLALQRDDAMREALKPFGIIETEYLLLLSILRESETTEHVTIGLASKSMSFSTGSPTKYADGLEAKGLIERYTTEHDRRKVYLRATSKGEQVADYASFAYTKAIIYCREVLV